MSPFGPPDRPPGHGPPEGQGQADYGSTEHGHRDHPPPSYGQPAHAPTGHGPQSYPQPAHGPTGYGPQSYAQPGHAPTGHGPQSYPQPVHGPTGHGPQSYPQPAHGPTGHGPQSYPQPVHGPTGHGPQSYPQPVHGPTHPSSYGQPSYAPQPHVLEQYRGGAAAQARPIVELTNVTKTFYRGKEPLTVLDGLNLVIPAGSFEALMGPSGSGKSTLLNLIAGLDKPTSGRAIVAESDLSQMRDGDLARFRARKIGFIFQSYNLMPVLTALENVELPLLLTKLPASERRKRCETALRVVGLKDRMTHYPQQLSGGQEQRVAIARAIVHDPTILICDEPTGDLDRNSADEILQLLTKLNAEFQKTILMVTHDPAAAERATITRHLNKGRLA